MQLVCNKCGYAWNTKSKAKRVSCSKCKTSITIHTPKQHEPKAEELVPIPKEATQTLPPPNTNTNNNNNNKIITEVKFPVLLWFDKRLEQRFFHSKSTGENHVILKVDKDGILSL
jgi:hypothetical protein